MAATIFDAERRKPRICTRLPPARIAAIASETASTAFSILFVTELLFSREQSMYQF
jgi:hypothetical protein